MLDEIWLDCPYCGAPISILVDTSVARQRYVEDCEVCCKPMDIDCTIDATGPPRVTARRGDD